MIGPYRNVAVLCKTSPHPRLAKLTEMVHRFSMKEELMDQALVEFRKATAKENRGRPGLQRALLTGPAGAR